MNVYDIAAEWEHYKQVIGKTDDIGRKEFINGALMVVNTDKKAWRSMRFGALNDMPNVQSSNALR
jgi:hypothetical protein